MLGMQTNPEMSQLAHAAPPASTIDGHALRQNRVSDARGRKVDPRFGDIASRPFLWIGKKTTKEFKLYQAVRVQLLEQLGEAPSTTQNFLISRCAWLIVHLAKIDARALGNEEWSEHASHHYLAWNNALVRTLARLGIKSGTEVTDPQTLLNEYFAYQRAEDDA